MGIKIIAAAFAAFLLAAPARADEAKPAPTAKQSVMTFFKHLKESLSSSAVSGERKRGRVGAVAAVRGADQKSALADPNEPVLKGDLRARKDKAAAAEDAEFAAAVDLVLKGQTAEGVAALEAFKTKHPKSRNLDKVSEAIEQAKSLSPAAPVEAAKPEQPKAEAPKAAAPAKN
ncbi:MAG: hypothetical protein HY079_02825 [Elusimicrobia bacterium]|nr:hypothetical protein [Elusimicrobiota bacterium]